jgi:hypothetical protein
VICQAVNEGSLSLVDLSFIDDVSQSSVVKNFKKVIKRFLGKRTAYLETFEKSLMTSGTRVSGPNYSKIWVY